MKDPIVLPISARAGWVLNGPKKYAKGGILEMLASMRLCANVPMQHAIQTALGSYQSISEFIQPGVRLYEQRERTWQLLNDIPGASCVKPQGALLFYMFPRIDAKRFNIRDDQKLVLDLLLQEKVLLVESSEFNWPYQDHVRIVTLARVDELEMAVGKLGRFLETLPPVDLIWAQFTAPLSQEGIVWLCCIRAANTDAASRMTGIMVSLAIVKREHHEPEPLFCPPVPFKTD